MWKVVQTGTYRAISAQLRSRVERFDLVYSAVEWALQRNPEDYEAVEGQRGIRQIKTRAFGATPAMRFLYSCNDDEVILRYVEIMEPPGNGGIAQLLPDGGW